MNELNRNAYRIRNWLPVRSEQKSRPRIRGHAFCSLSYDLRPRGTLLLLPDSSLEIITCPEPLQDEQATLDPDQKDD